MIQISRISLRRWSAMATIAIVAATSALPAQAQHGRYGGGGHGRPEYRGGGYRGGHGGGGYRGGHGGGGGGLAGGLVVGALLGAVAGVAISNATQAPPADVYSAPPPPPPPGAYYYPNSYPAGY